MPPSSNTRVLPHFGADSTYLAFTQRTALPAWIVRKLLRWHELGVLREPKLMAFLRQAQATSSAPEHMANLLSLLEENLAYSMFQAVETTKRELSDAATSQLHFHAGDIALDIAVRRDAFEAWMAPLLARINAAVDQVLAACPGRMPDAGVSHGRHLQNPSRGPTVCRPLRPGPTALGRRLHLGGRGPGPGRRHAARLSLCTPVHV